MYDKLRPIIERSLARSFQSIRTFENNGNNRDHIRNNLSIDIDQIPLAESFVKMDSPEFTDIIGGVINYRVNPEESGYRRISFKLRQDGAILVL